MSDYDEAHTKGRYEGEANNTSLIVDNIVKLQKEFSEGPK